jgi:predicted metal-dependent phosphotriesterase family hydrolase
VNVINQHLNHAAIPGDATEDCNDSKIQCMNKSLLLFLIFISFRVWGQNGDAGFIYSVNGKLTIEKLDISLTHEHIMSDFGADPAYKAQYDTTALFNQVIPYLKQIRSQGVISIFDCTAAYFGREVTLLKKIANATGIQIITNTGFYGAARDKYIPMFAFDASVEEIAKIWIAEFENGIDQTGIKPGFIKLGFDEGEPSAIDIKLFKAGIQTHLNTGLTMVVHTGNNPMAAKEQLRLLMEKKVSPAAWVWAHANFVDNMELLAEGAVNGAWISLDGAKGSNLNEYIEKITYFRERKLLHKILLSHDGNSFPRGAGIRKYETITMELIPALRKLGYSDNEINQLMIKNPREAFKIKVKPIE